MNAITSTKNQTVKMLKRLSTKDGRDETGLFLVEGEVMIKEALKCGLKPYIALAVNEKLEVISGMDCESCEVTAAIMEAVCDTKSPQGACAAFYMRSPVGTDDMPNKIVALDGVQDPGNIGTIWRTADAAGFQAVLFGEGCADPHSPKVQRASMGSGFRLPYSETRNLSNSLSVLRNKGYQIICSSLNGVNFYDHPPLGEKFVLVIGSEARGISENVANTATMLLKLPMRGGAESLNAAVAAGIMMYELTK